MRNWQLWHLFLLLQVCLVVAIAAAKAPVDTIGFPQFPHSQEANPRSWGCIKLQFLGKPKPHRSHGAVPLLLLLHNFERQLQQFTSLFQASPSFGHLGPSSQRAAIVVAAGARIVGIQRPARPFFCQFVDDWQQSEKCNTSVRRCVMLSKGMDNQIREEVNKNDQIYATSEYRGLSEGSEFKHSHFNPKP